MIFNDCTSVQEVFVSEVVTNGKGLLHCLSRLTSDIIDKDSCANIQCSHQCLSQYLETGCLKLAVVKILKGDHNMLIFQQLTCINSSK